MTQLTQYKDIFGAPGTGLHSFRIFNIAVVDVALTLVAAYFIAQYTNYPLVYVVCGLLLLSVAVHYIFNVDTTVLKELKGAM